MLTNFLNKGRQASLDTDVERVLEKRDREERKAVQELYLSAVEDRVAELTVDLRSKITEELRGQFSEELEARVSSIRSQYEQRSSDGGPAAVFAAPPELVEEIAATQAELLKKEGELAKALSDDTALGTISRLRAEKRELEAYLKGLDFCAKLTLDRA